MYIDKVRYIQDLAKPLSALDGVNVRQIDFRQMSDKQELPAGEMSFNCSEYCSNISVSLSDTIVQT